MSGQNNFIEWNPTNANQETDATYQADSSRSGGAVNGIFSPMLANKVFRQPTMFVAAIALALSTKGLNIVDGSTPYQAAPTPSTGVSNLAATLAALLLTSDVIVVTNFEVEAGYMKFGPAFGGLIIQWGGTGNIATGTHTITFIIPFVNNQPAILLTPASSSITQYNIASSGLSTFGVNITTGTAAALFYLAIGN